MQDRMQNFFYRWTVSTKKFIVMSTIGRHLPKWKLIVISQAPKTLRDFSLCRNPLNQQRPKWLRSK